MRIRSSPALLIMVCLLVWATATQLWSARTWGHDNWQLSEWLINYAGGFVRRGLPGALIGWAADTTGIQANHIAILAAAGFYFLLAWWFLRRAPRDIPAVLVLSCIVLGFPAYQDSIIRKDSLGLLLLLGCVLADRSRWPRSLVILVINLLACVAILSHEAFAFYALPALVLFTRRDQEPLGGIDLPKRCLSLLPAAGCLAMVVMFHGTPDVAQAVNASWIPLWRAIDPGTMHPEHAAASIQALGWSSGKGMSLGITLLTSGFYEPLAWLMLFGLSFVLLVWFTGRDAEPVAALESRIRLSAILCMQWLAIAPLFLLGYDYGRWLFLWTASALMLHTEGIRAPRWVESLAGRVLEMTRVSERARRHPANDWYLLFFGIPVCWNMQSFIIASPVIRHLRIVWGWF